MSSPAELPGPLPYGPATARIRRFLQRLAGLSAVVEQDIVSQHDRIAAFPEYGAAELALGIAIARSGREREQAALAGPLLQLVQSKAAPEDSATNDDAQLREVAEPALAALLALMMQDVLAPAEFDLLYSSFAPVISLDLLA